VGIVEELVEIWPNEVCDNLRGKQEVVALAYDGGCQRAKLCARIKPTALCSVLDKENSIEFPLDFATLYIQLLL